jgi:membrane associated rhomboid family serine protease
MLIPISDAPNPRGAAIATWALIAANIAIFIFVNLPLGLQPADMDDPAMAEYLEFLSRFVGSRDELRSVVSRVSAYDLFVFKYGFRPAQPSVLDLLFSMFLHGGLMHLAGNMLFLWIYGDNVEHRLKPPVFVFWYLLTGIAATVFHAAFFAGSDVPLVGASGAISGVLGFYFVWFPKNTVRVVFFLPPFFWHVFEVPARIVLGIYLIIDNLLPFVFSGAGGVAHGAHIGGFLAGVGAAWVISRRATVRDVREIGVAPRSPRSVADLRDAIRDDRIVEAATEFFQLPRGAAREALSGSETVALADRLRRAGHARAALALLQRMIQIAPPKTEMAELYAMAGQILLEELGDASAAYQYLWTARRLGPSRRTADAIGRSLAAIENLQRVHPGRMRR